MNQRLESDLLRTLVAISEAKNFTKASKIVGRTQSAVSVQMKKLEEIVGGRLFERGPRGVTLTLSGEQLVKDAKRIISLLDQAVASFHSDPLDGFIRIGVPEEYGGTILPRVLSTFSKAHPNVEVTVHSASSTELKRAYDTSELDLVVTHEDASMIGGELLINDPVVWVTSDTHMQHECNPMPIAICERGCWWREWAVDTLNYQETNYRVAYESNSISGLQAAASSGMAVAILSQSQVPSDCRELTAAEGYPPLQGSNITLRQQRKSKCNIVAGMAQAIREAFQTSLPFSQH